MYVSVGSYSNAQDRRRGRDRPRAILAFDPDGGNRRVFATGLRNPVSLSFSPHNGALWATDNERDELGDDLVPDFVTAGGAGAVLGWPWFYIGETSIHAMPASYPVGPPAGERPEGAAAGAFGEPGLGLLHRHAVPGRVPRQPVRRHARLLEPRPTRPAPR